MVPCVIIVWSAACLGGASVGGRGGSALSRTGGSIEPTMTVSSGPGPMPKRTNPKSVSVPNLSSPEACCGGTPVVPPLPPPVHVTENSNSSCSSSLFDGLSAIARVRHLINSTTSGGGGNNDQGHSSGGGGIGSSSSIASSTTGFQQPGKDSIFSVTHHPHPHATTNNNLNNNNNNAPPHAAGRNNSTSSTSGSGSGGRAPSNLASIQNHDNNNAQTNNPFLFGRPPHSVSSLFRIALSSNFPGWFYVQLLLHY